MPPSPPAGKAPEEGPLGGAISEGTNSYRPDDGPEVSHAGNVATVGGAAGALAGEVGGHPVDEAVDAGLDQAVGEHVEGYPRVGQRPKYPVLAEQGVDRLSC